MPETTTPATVDLFGHQIPVNDNLKTAEMRFFDEARQDGRNLGSIGFMLDYVAVAVNVRCKPAKKVRSADFDDLDFDLDEVTGAFNLLLKPILDRTKKPDAGDEGNAPPTGDESTG